MAHGQGLPPNWNEDRRASLYGALIVFIVLGVVTVSSRIGLQAWAQRRLFWDDLFIVLALIFNLGLIACDLFGMTRGLGLHIERVMATDPHPPDTFITLWKVGFINSLCIYITLFCIKMSLLWLYRRLFWIAPWFRIGWYANLIFAIALALSAVFTAIFQCTPVAFAWERMYLLTHIPPPDGRHISGHCIDNKYTTWIASISVASDVAIWLLPFTAVLKLQMTIRRKIELCSLLSLGFFACACGIAKAVINDQAVSARDVSWANAPLAIWASAEQTLGILCACIPVMAGAVKQVHATRKSNSSRPYQPRSDFSDKQRAKPKSDFTDTTTSITTTDKTPPRTPARQPHQGTFLKSTGRDSIDEVEINPMPFPPPPFHGERGASDDLEMQPPRRQADWV